MPNSLVDLRRELRTQEAHGEGTDVRLVLLEAAMVAGRLDVLDAWLRQLSGRRSDDSSGFVTDRKGLQVALRADDPVFDKIGRIWEGLDLQEVTMRLREVEDLLDLLLRGRRGTER